MVYRHDTWYLNYFSSDFENLVKGHHSGSRVPGRLVRVGTTEAAEQFNPPRKQHAVFLDRGLSSELRHPLG